MATKDSSDDGTTGISTVLQPPVEATTDSPSSMQALSNDYAGIARLLAKFEMTAKQFANQMETLLVSSESQTRLTSLWEEQARELERQRKTTKQSAMDVETEEEGDDEAGDALVLL